MTHNQKAQDLGFHLVPISRGLRHANNQIFEAGSTKFPIWRVSTYQVVTFKLFCSNDRLSSSHDDTILILDFLNAEKDGENGDTH